MFLLKHFVIIHSQKYSLNRQQTNNGLEFIEPHKQSHSAIGLVIYVCNTNINVNIWSVAFVQSKSDILIFGCENRRFVITKT